MADKTALSPGYYLGVSRRTRNFSFQLPKERKGASDLTMDSFWNRLVNGSKAESTAPVNNATNEKSTSFSGWITCSNAVNLSNKCYAAPQIYHAAGGEDPTEAAEAVRRFKQTAARVLGRCADNDTTLDASIEREINATSCIVHEVKVVLLVVSQSELSGTKYDPKTNLYYGERTLRKFYLKQQPLDTLLIAFRDELADPGTNVAGDYRLHAVRSDKVTYRTGRAAYTSGFKIETCTTYVQENAAIQAARDRILAKQQSLRAST